MNPYPLVVSHNGVSSLVVGGKSAAVKFFGKQNFSPENVFTMIEESGALGKLKYVF
jgi:hypothetical protein